jgi:imidazolonepropionase-like amidohydrolase
MKYFLYDSRQADRTPNDVIPAEHTPSAVVSRMAADGAICYEPGPPSGPLPIPTPEMFQGLVAAARAKSMPVVIHANVKAGHRALLDAGADIITHTIADGLGPDGQLTRDVDEILTRIAEQRIGYQPTLRALHGSLALFDENYLKDPRLSAAVPRGLPAWFSTADGGRYRQEMLAGAGGETAFRSRAAARLRSYELVIRRLASSNARLLFGSDTPATASYGSVPGLNSRLEMDQWIRGGVTELQLFRALTIENARAFRLDKDLGSVEVGKRAHLLLLRMNPLESVEAYDAIETVILAGRPVERQSLSALN